MESSNNKCQQSFGDCRNQGGSFGTRQRYISFFTSLTDIDKPTPSPRSLARIEGHMFLHGSISSVPEIEQLELRNSHGAGESERDAFLSIPTGPSPPWNNADECIEKTDTKRALLCLVLQHFSKLVNTVFSDTS